MTRILFVDDDEFVLHGLRRLLTFAHDDWAPTFSTSGTEALRLCAEQDFDVIVTDMRMPEIDGAELLETIADLYPDMVRVVLSGQSERKELKRAATAAHQLLSKPCNLNELESAITKHIASERSPE